MNWLSLLKRRPSTAQRPKKYFQMSSAPGDCPSAIVEKKGLAQVSDTGALDQFVRDAIEANPKSVQDYKEGKEAALQFLVGQVMRVSRGKSQSPRGVLHALKARLDG